MSNEVRDAIVELLKADENMKVAELTDEADLYEAGLTSFATVQLMLALEDRFAVEFPETLLNRSTFASIARIQHSVEKLVAEKG